MATDPSTPTKRFLFVCGCPRSGTSALEWLLTSHPKIVLGRERYITRAFHGGGLDKELFEKQRFFDMQVGDTFYGDLEQFGYFYPRMERRFDTALYVGDKIPTLFYQLTATEAKLPGAHFLVMSRNIYDVASSYEWRAQDAEDPTWAASRGYELAVKEWNDANRLTEQFMLTTGKSDQVTVVQYEEMFSPSAVCEPLFATLGLEVGEATDDTFHYLLWDATKLAATRRTKLTDEMRAYIDEHADFAARDRLLELRLKLS